MNVKIGEAHLFYILTELANLVYLLANHVCKTFDFSSQNFDFVKIWFYWFCSVKNAWILKANVLVIWCYKNLVRGNGKFMYTFSWK